MTTEEALETIKIAIADVEWNYPLDYSIAFETAIEALEKQIPKKPLHMHKNYYCPICKEDGWILWDDAIPNDMDKYCGKCGQAISWGVY